MAITNLKEIGESGTRKLLEACGITIKKTASDHFGIICPNCNKPEAYIYFKSGAKIIQCNRKNKCDYDKSSLWDHIAKKQGMSPDNKKEMLKYINNILGLDFDSLKEKIMNDNNEYLEQDAKELKFLTDCKQIFFNKLHNSLGNKQTEVTWKYLKEERGYTEEQIESFGLGFFPDEKNLHSSLTNEPYNYTKDLAKELTKKYFEGILKVNWYQEQEHKKNRITFPWYSKGNVAGFTVRKATNNKELKESKYMINNGFERTKVLFNFDNAGIRDKTIVIVEGVLDALSANYYISQQTENLPYHFIATGSNNISDKQIECLKSAGCSKVILLPDKDKAGEGFLNSKNKLRELGIETYIASIPDEYKVKDIDELLRKHKEINLDNLLILKNMETIPNISNDNIISIDPIKLELERLKDDIQQEQKTNEPIDIHKYRKKGNDLKKLILKNDIAANPKGKLALIDIIISNAKLYNDLLKTDYDNDTPYTSEQLLERVIKSPEGLKTGFTALDEHVIIQPNTLVSVAGKPSHGKTTMMLNMLRNMIKTYPDKSFIFYSYEEKVEQIWQKLILIELEPCTELKEGKAENKTYLQEITRQLKNYKMCSIKEEGRNMSTFSSSLCKAYNEVKNWIDEGRLKLLDKKPTVEILSSAIIEQVARSQKPVAAIFVDYVQKLNSEKEKANRQQDLQLVCKSLLDTALERSVEAAIIVGAQVNRDVKSLSTFDVSKMREAADIEQDSSLVLGVWNQKASELDDLRLQLEEVQKKKLLQVEDSNNYKSLESREETLKEKIKNKETGTTEEEIPIQIKILKNRNGKKDVVIDLNGFPDRFLVKDKIKNKTNYLERYKENLM